jgi:peptidoglycan hydrolase-like protein with peptidoglycan-binding domain
MIDRPRAALAALTLACTLALPAFAREAGAQARPTPQPAVLPAARARPPVRRPAPAPAPAPAARPVATAPRPAARPAADTARRSATPGSLASNGEKWEQITPEIVNTGTRAFPIGRGHSGASVLRVQLLLDRAYFSTGMIDGRWGKNTTNAVQWLQTREGLPATGTVDSVTYARLEELAGAPAELVRRHALTAEDVRGPFAPIPANIYEHARLRCSCYESLGEKLTELFHVRRDLLQKLNPGVDLDKLAAGDSLSVLDVRDMSAPPAGKVAMLLISGPDNYLQAVDSAGRILYHFAATLGSTFDPSPEGDFRVVSMHDNPWWRYQPRILAHVPDWKPEALIPPGPNNSVGRVWMALSAPHYGIHGTKSPETIGYAQSAGCVRLTNWDVMFLSKRLTPGVPVQFRGTRTPPAATPARAPGTPTSAAPTPGVRADSTARDTAAAPPRDTTRTRPSPAPRDTARARPAPAPRDTARRDTTRRETTATPRPAAPAAAAPAPARTPVRPDSAARTP